MSQKRIEIFKIGKTYPIDSDSSRVRRKKSGKLWSTDNAVLYKHSLTHPEAYTAGVTDNC